MREERSALGFLSWIERRDLGDQAWNALRTIEFSELDCTRVGPLRSEGTIGQTSPFVTILSQCPALRNLYLRITLLDLERDPVSKELLPLSPITVGPGQTQTCLAHLKMILDAMPHSVKLLCFSLELEPYDRGPKGPECAVVMEELVSVTKGYLENVWGENKVGDEGIEVVEVVVDEQEWFGCTSQ